VFYHNINSVCAQKVRIALAEKGQPVKEYLLTLQGDQNDPAYMKLNPNGVVPTLVHDGNVIVESSLILYYIDEAFPDPPLMPKTPAARHRVRLYNKLIDEYMHNACTIMTFATAFRPRFLKMSREQWLAEINKAPLKRRPWLLGRNFSLAQCHSVCGAARLPVHSGRLDRGAATGRGLVAKCENPSEFFRRHREAP
jgi:glutathione S-transferase